MYYLIVNFCKITQLSTYSIDNYLSNSARTLHDKKISTKPFL